MKDVIKSFDDLPWIAKLILCLPVLNLSWAIYRIVKGVSEKKTSILVAGILWIVPGAVISWVVDLICTICYKRPTLFA